MGKYFGTDGIRGKTNEFPITVETALRVGVAAGRFFRRGDYPHRAVIGKDTRLSGYMVESALVAGLTSMGTNVFQLGPIPTPAVAILTKSLRCDLGIMISASHNGYQDNGIKLFGPDGYKMSIESESEIEGLIDLDLNYSPAHFDKIGRSRRIDNAHGRYIEYVKNTLPRQVRFEGLRIVIDCANGAAYKVAPEVLWEMGAEIYTIGVNPNGRNINRDCGSTSLNKIKDKVKETRADIGIALDGDADRVILIDEKSNEINGDQIMALIATNLKKQGKLVKNGVVSTIMSNLGLERYLASQKIDLVRTNVGDRYVVEHMRNFGYNFGGEQSGHLILGDVSTTGDGLIVALQILSELVSQGKRASEICNMFEPVPQIMENIYTKKKDEALNNSEVVDFISKSKESLGGEGRLVIRPSGTEDLIRIMAEGDDRKKIKTLVANVSKKIKTAALEAEM